MTNSEREIGKNTNEVVLKRRGVVKSSKKKNSGRGDHYNEEGKGANKKRSSIGIFEREGKAARASGLMSQRAVMI